MMLVLPSRRVGASSLTRLQFVLLFGAMLVAAAGNTALQAVIPAIGRQMGVDDLWVTFAYTSSAVLWVWLAPYWARRSDRHGRKPLILLGLGSFILSNLLCAAVLAAGLAGLVGAGLTFLLFAFARAVYGAVGCAVPSATQAYIASRTRRSARVAQLTALSSSFGLGTIIGPALAPLFVLPLIGLPGPLLVFALIAVAVFLAIWGWLPRDRGGGGHGAAMSYPSFASNTTGASVIAATAPRSARLRWNDPRIRSWILAGVAAGHAQAGTLTTMGFFVIDRLSLDPARAHESIAIVMMAGASAALAGQWGLIPRLDLKPRTMILWGSAIAAAGLAATMAADGLYGLIIGCAIASLGFGFTRPGYAAGASLAVSRAEQGGVAGLITSANGIAFVAAPGAGMALYALDRHLPFIAAILLLLALIGCGRRALRDV